MAAKMAQEGRSVEEINAYLEESIARRRIYFGIYNLKYAGKSGRIPSAAAFIGDKIGIKPIMKIWDHEITTAGKCRGEKKVVSKICDMAIADSLDMARQVISRLVQKLQRMQVQELSVLHLMLRNNFYRVKDFVKVEGT